MHTKIKYTLIRTDSQGYSYVAGTCESEDFLQQMIARAKASKPLDKNSYEVTKETTTVVTETIEEFEVDAVSPTVDSVVAEAISMSEGQREFYYPEDLEYFTTEEKALVKEEVEKALDYCDHCGHLVDAGELSDDYYGSRLCDMCYSQQEEKEDDE